MSTFTLSPFKLIYTSNSNLANYDFFIFFFIIFGGPKNLKVVLKLYIKYENLIMCIYYVYVLIYNFQHKWIKKRN